MIIVLACGCTSESKTNAETTTQTKSADTAQADSKTATTVEKASKYPITKEKITVKAMVVPGSFASDDNKKILWDCLEKLTNVYLKAITVEKEQQSVYLASGDWPDFFITPLTNSEINAYGVEGGKFVNYNDYIEYMPNLAACYKKYPIAKKIVTNTDGTVYQLPEVHIRSTSVDVRAHYRADVLNNLGLKVPATTDEFHDVLSAIYKAKGKAPLVSTMVGGDYEEFLFGAFGEGTCGDFDSIDGKTVVFNRISEQYKHYLEYASQLYSEDLIYEEFLTLNTATIKALAQEDTAVFAYHLSSLTAKDFASGKIEVGTLAPLTSQYSNKQKLLGANNYLLSGYAINKNSRYVKEICQLLDIAFATEEVEEGTGLYGKAFLHGPEGITWEYKDDKKTSYDYIVPKGIDMVGTSYINKYVLWSNTGLYDGMEVTAQEGNPRIRQLGYIQNAIPYQYDPFPGRFMSYTPDEQSVIDSKYTEISTYVKEMRGKFITGIKNVKTDWDEYVATIKKMGIEDVLKVYQEAYDRWNKL
jgi:putative aldouronate transport system substrate-binding protein